jgi:hypothetical protein
MASLDAPVLPMIPRSEQERTTRLEESFISKVHSERIDLKIHSRTGAVSDQHHPDVYIELETHVRELESEEKDGVANRGNDLATRPERVGFWTRLARASTQK